MEKNKNVPKLRFPEFTGEWEEKKLGEIMDYTKGYAFQSEHYLSKGVRIIRVSDLGAREIKSEGDKIYIDERITSNLEKYKLYKEDIIITTVGSKPDMVDSSVGRGIFINKDNEGLLNQNMLKINKSEKVNNKFLIGYINTDKYFRYIKLIQRGNANQSNITVVDLLEYEIYLPSLPEQTKIASFLTAVDEKLTQLKKKKTLLEQYKKGIMQKLFSQELRFKEDNNQDFPDWQEKTLGEISKITNGNGDVQDASLEAKEGWYPFYDRSEIVKYLDRYTFDGEAVIYPGEGQSFFPRYFNGKYGLHQRCYTIKDYCANIHGKYLYYYLSTQNNYFVAFAVGSTVPSLRLDTFQQAKVFIPSLPEQQKISNFLSSIDEKISHCSAQIEKMEAWKKGLLQQMFC
nr:restriction endonuclease subunit S [uncultured Macellibacteroides sp.]